MSWSQATIELLREEKGAGPERAGLPEQRAAFLLNPWVWVLIAAVLRFGALASLPWTADRLALEGVPGALAPQAGETPGFIDFLQRRVQARPLNEDEHSYDEMARNLVRGRGFVLDSVWLVTTPGQPAMYAGCTYPLFVAGVYVLFGSGHQLPVFITQILLQALAVLLIFRASNFVAGRLSGAIGAAFFALHPTLIWLSVAMMSEAVVVPLVAALAWLLVDRGAAEERAVFWPWRRILMIGVILGLLCLARSVFAHFVWIVAALVAYQGWTEQSLRRGTAQVAVCLVAFVAVCTPWTWRNYVHWNRFIPFSTKSGATAWMHNHPGLRVDFGPAAVFGPQPIDIFDPRIQDLPDEAARDATLMAMFQDFVRQNPAKFLGLVWMRFWMAILPVTVTAKSLLAVAAAWYSKATAIAVVALGFSLASRRLAGRVLPWALFVSYWQAIQSLAGSGMRYRLPAEPVWSCLIGVLGAVTVAAWWPQVDAFPLARRWLRAPATRTSDTSRS